MRFIHTADIHLGKTYRNSPASSTRYDDFFEMLSKIVHEAVRERVDALLIAGDLFHTGQILPRTFARTIEALLPLKEAGIPCVAVEGNHDWIHRRDTVSWMEALSQMGYIRLLRPCRTEGGGYRFDPFDLETGSGGRIEIAGTTIYGLGYIGSQAGSHVQRICDAVETQNNILLFHAGIWNYSPVEIGNVKPEEALPLADKFRYVALGHGHKPYVVSTLEGRPYAFNPGAPERVNFGEERYDKGYWLVTVTGDKVSTEFRPLSPRPMLSVSVNLDGVADAGEALARFRERLGEILLSQDDPRQPLVEVKLNGRVGFHPFEVGREKLRGIIDEIRQPLHVEILNRLSLSARTGEEGGEQRSLVEIEREVLQELIGAGSVGKGREDELTTLALRLREHVMKGETDGEALLALLGEVE